MAKKNKKSNINQLKNNVSKARSKNPEHVDWKLCADTVDSLYIWINELCDENYRLKTLIRQTIKKLQEDNAQTKEILDNIEPMFQKIAPDSTDTQD